MVTLYGLLIGIFVAGALGAVLALDDLVETIQDHNVSRRVFAAEPTLHNSERLVLAAQHRLMCALDLGTALAVCCLAGYLRFNPSYTVLFEIPVPAWLITFIVIATGLFTVRLLQRRRIRYLLLDRDRRMHLEELLERKAREESGDGRA